MSKKKFTIIRIFGYCWSTFGDESRMMDSLLHVMRPYQEAITCSTSTEKVMARTLYDEFEVMLLCKVDRCLNVTLRSGIDANRWHASLFTRNSQSSVQITCFYMSLKFESLEIDALHGSWLLWTPVTVREMCRHVFTATSGCWRGIACWRRGTGPYNWLG